ncbi:MAG: hypothetical protein MJ053_03860 [Elusimicrobiaceae bacterium]|nr:hypothetical protein [Elusimicrobiaceae bacterium]
MKLSFWHAVVFCCVVAVSCLAGFLTRPEPPVATAVTAAPVDWQEDAVPAEVQETAPVHKPAPKPQAKPVVLTAAQTLPEVVPPVSPTPASEEKDELEITVFEEAREVEVSTEIVEKNEDAPSQPEPEAPAL